VLCLVFTTSACWHFTTRTKSGPEPASGLDPEALIVSVEDVRRIANSEELAAHAHSDLRRPSPGDFNAPGTCRAVGNSEASYASGWTQYREVGYSGVTDDIQLGGRPMIDKVSQAVVVYPDGGAASGALHALDAQLTACADLHDNAFNFTLDRPDSATVRLSSQGWSHQYRVKASVLVSVGVLGIEPAEPIATTILQTMTDRIK
jgi:PknH-like extracellular domain